jgi:NAD(P)-dependent dehydrogenase (short-subunit alcohol dehydrogenase family)
MKSPWAVVLGYSSGAGAAIAEALARDPGYDVFGVHRGNHPELAAEVCGRVREHGHSVHERRADAGTHRGAAEGCAELLEVAGPGSVAFFVHALANASLGPLTDPSGKHLDAEQISRTFDGMAHSFVYWVQEMLARELLAPGARILGLTNNATVSVVGHLPAIAASKAALEIYVRHLAHELGPSGYLVSLLRFGAVETAALRKVFPDASWRHMVEVHERISPRRRMTDITEVARFASYLTREEAAPFHGATIDFTGGEAISFYHHLLQTERPPTDR